MCQLADRLAHARHARGSPPPAKIFVLLSSSLLMLSGEIYLRLKPYLVVKISFYVVTEHCCQVCVLSMMFCRSDCRLCADMVSDCASRKLRRTMWFAVERSKMTTSISIHIIANQSSYHDDKSTLQCFTCVF